MVTARAIHATATGTSTGDSWFGGGYLHPVLQQYGYETHKVPPSHWSTPDGGTWKIRGKPVPVPAIGETLRSYISRLQLWANENDPEPPVAVGKFPKPFWAPLGTGWESLEKVLAADKK